jgi:hypothetical protein
MSLLIGLKNTATQTVDVDGLINLGSVYRRYDKKGCQCGLRAFEVNANGITLQQSGIYHITAIFESAAAATVQLLVNGVAIDGAVATDTQSVIDYFVVVDSGCVLGNNTTVAQSISFQNTGAAATFTNVIVNVVKEV